MRHSVRLASVIVCVALAAAGCVASPPQDAAWATLADADRLVFARERYAAADTGANWGTGLITAGAIAFTTGFVLVLSQTGDAHDPKPVVRSGLLTMMAAASALGTGGVIRGNNAESRLAWAAELRRLGDRPPP